jgi:hypothetical protein
VARTQASLQFDVVGGPAGEAVSRNGGLAQYFFFIHFSQSGRLFGGSLILLHAALRPIGLDYRYE